MSKQHIYNLKYPYNLPPLLTGQPHDKELSIQYQYVHQYMIIKSSLIYKRTGTITRHTVENMLKN